MERLMFRLAELRAGTGWLGLSSLPGRNGNYQTDLAQMLAWRPQLVLSMTEMKEMELFGAKSLGSDLSKANVEWRHLPIADFSAPESATAANWPEASKKAHAILASGGRVLVHCKGGCGRSGMVVLRLLVERGESPEEALARLRRENPDAVETKEQYLWAAHP